MNRNNTAHFCHELKADGIVFFYVTSFFIYRPYSSTRQCLA